MERFVRPSIAFLNVVGRDGHAGVVREGEDALVARRPQIVVANVPVTSQTTRLTDRDQHE